MKYRYMPGRASRYPAMAGYFFLLLMAVTFYGCATAEKTPTEDTFLLERARHTRESGNAAYAEGDYRRALLKYREAFEIDSRINGQSGQISDLIGAGRAYTGLGNEEQATRYLTRAVKKAFSSRDDRGLSRAYSALARSYLKGRKYSLALQNVNDAISLERAGGREPLELFNLAAVIYLKAGRLNEAGLMIESALRAVATAPGPARLADIYRIKAVILSKKGDIAGSMRYFDMAYDVDRALEDNRKMALDLWSAAVVLIDSGRYDEAVTRLKKSYLLYRKSGFLEGAVRDLDKLVEVYLALGDKKSERYYRNMKEAVLADMR